MSDGWQEDDWERDPSHFLDPYDDCFSEPEPECV